MPILQCWICYGEEQVDTFGIEFPLKWVSPCQCRGSLEWVHQQCIRSWITSAESRSGSSSGATDSAQHDLFPTCPHCKFPFSFEGEPPATIMPLIQRFLGRTGVIYRRAVQAIITGAFAGGLYSALYSYSLAATIAFCGAGTTWRALIKPCIQEVSEISQKPLPAITGLLRLALFFPAAFPAVLFSLRTGDSLWMLPLASMWVSGEQGRRASRLTRAIVLSMAPISTLLHLFWIRLKRRSHLGEHADETANPASRGSQHDPDSAPGSFFEPQNAQPNTTPIDQASPLLDVIDSPTNTTAITIDMTNFAVDTNIIGADGGVASSGGVRGAIVSVLETLAFPFISSAIGMIIGGIGSLLFSGNRKEGRRLGRFEMSSVGAAVVLSMRLLGELIRENRKRALLRSTEKK